MRQSRWLRRCTGLQPRDQRAQRRPRDEQWQTTLINANVREGAPTSIMHDGAHLPFEENIATTRKVVEIAHAFGIPVEAELGKIPDVGESVNWAKYYTDVEEARRFAAETGIDYLAIPVGIVHGVIPGITPEPISIRRIREIKAATDIPLVLHGASGLTAEEVKQARRAILPAVLGERGKMMVDL